MKEITKQFLEIKTLAELASVLGIHQKVLNYFLIDGITGNHYTSFLIPKKAGGSRTIEAPNKQLKFIQKKLKGILEDLYIPKISTHGYVKTKSIVTNASPHIGKSIILNIDIKDFFASIHFGRVFGLFQKQPFNFNPTIAKALTKLVCYNRRLPQGAPTSPVISNFIARGLDNELIKLCAKHKLVYTRYCDDITISTKSLSFPDVILDSNEKIGNVLWDIIKKNNFEVNTAKVRVQKRKSRQMVTGLVVNEKPNILNKKYRHLRTIVYYTWLNDLEEGAIKNQFILTDQKPDVNRFLEYLRGSINYYKMVMGIYSSKYQLLANYFNEIVEKEVFPIPENIETIIHNYVFVIENGKRQGTGFYVKKFGLVSCLHNFWDIAKEVDEGELKKRLEEYYAFLPTFKNRTYSLKIKKICAKEDLIVFEMIYFNKDGGFEFARDIINVSLTNKTYIAAGYPGYSETSNQLSIVRALSVTQERELEGQKLYIVDKSFYSGASGGPVLNESGKVVGVIDRGNEYGKKEENYSAFCPVSPIWS